MEIKKVGDIISWKLDSDRGVIKKGIYSAEIAMVDLKEKHYGVWVDYGFEIKSQDLIPFDDVLDNNKPTSEELLRELSVRGNYVFPQIEQEVEWFEQGTDRLKSDFMERLFNYFYKR